ncbi:MAG: patatin-like phospholipase family protein [Chthoniobacterales bacterium]|nr:patatin-like phospholipase family protein [Chthoniobacterales bacterium]
MDIAPDRTTFSGIPNKSDAWNVLTKEALQNKNLSADIRVDESGTATIVKNHYALWRAIKPWFGYSTPTKEETIENLKIHFTRYVLSQPFKEKVVIDEGKFKGILEDLQNNANKFSTSKAIQLAHNEILKLLNKTNAEKKGVDPTPQVVLYSKSENDITVPSVTIIEPAPDYEEISFSGGGNKGSGYGGAYRVLEESGKLKKLQRVSGSSVGTIPAAFTAVGMNAAEFDQASEEIEALDFMRESKNAEFKKKLKEHITFDNSKLGHEGTLALEKINKKLIGTAYSYLTSIKEEKEWNNLDETLERPFMSEFFHLLADGFTPFLTFKHLALLRKMNPEKFKDLSICVYNESDDKPVFLNSAAYNDPDIEDSEKEKILTLPLVVAIRMSAAFPIAFKPVKWEGNVMKDGGIIVNNPSSKFKRGQYQQNMSKGTSLTAAQLAKASRNHEDHSKILYLTFDYGGETYDVLHQGKIEVARSLGMSLKERITKNFRFRRDKTQENAHLWLSGPNVKVVYHGLLETLSFWASKKRREAAKLQAEIKMREQLAHHQHEATYRTYSLTELLNIFGNHPEKITNSVLEAIVKKSTEEQEKLERFKDFKSSDANLMRSNKKLLEEVTSLLKAARTEKEKRSTSLSVE